MATPAGLLDEANGMVCNRGVDDGTHLRPARSPQARSRACLQARLAFLEHELASAPDDRPLLLFQHHPPFDTGLRYMDGIKLANPEAEWDVIARTRKPD